MIVPPLAAWAGHTDQSRGQAQSLKLALRQCGVTDETCATLMRLGTEDFSHQVNGRKALSLWRLGYLAAERRDVYLAFLKLEVRRFGGECLTKEDRELLLAAAQLGLGGLKSILPGFFHADSFDHERRT